MPVSTSTVHFAVLSQTENTALAEGLPHSGVMCTGWGVQLGAHPGALLIRPCPQLEGAPEDDLELPLHGRQGSPTDLSCDSRGNSDYDTETDGEAFTDGDEGEDGCPPARTPSPQPPGVAQVEGRHAQGQRPQDSMR